MAQMKLQRREQTTKGGGVKGEFLAR
jgi:hypothetical protein